MIGWQDSTLANDRPGRFLPLIGVLSVFGVFGLLLLGGCAAGTQTRPRPTHDGNPPVEESQAPAQTSGQAQPEHGARPGTRVAALEFVRAHENLATADFFPLERITGCAYSPEGTLIFCDESRGKVFGFDERSQLWFEFDAPRARPYQPQDVIVDGFKVLVLDSGGGSIYRYDLSGAWQGELLDVRRVDPAVISRGMAFAVDRDGRMVVADEAQQQLLLLDPFLSLDMRLGDPGTLDDQFSAVSGVAFTPDGSILASDAGNSRLSLYGRLGFFEDVIGGRYAAPNPFVAPAGLECDRFGNVFVADPGAAKIHILDARLRYDFSSGDEFGLRANLISPVDVAISPDGLLAVTDQARSAIIIYRIIYE